MALQSRRHHHHHHEEDDLPDKKEKEKPCCKHGPPGCSGLRGLPGVPGSASASFGPLSLAGGPIPDEAAVDITSLLTVTSPQNGWALGLGIGYGVLDASLPDDAVLSLVGVPTARPTALSTITGVVRISLLAYPPAQPSLTQTFRFTIWISPGTLIAGGTVALLPNIWVPYAFVDVPLTYPAGLTVPPFTVIQAGFQQSLTSLALLPAGTLLAVVASLVAPSSSIPQGTDLPDNGLTFAARIE